jgi:hypothetical protein
LSDENHPNLKPGAAGFSGHLRTGLVVSSFLAGRPVCEFALDFCPDRRCYIGRPVKADATVARVGRAMGVLAEPDFQGDWAVEGAALPAVPKGMDTIGADWAIDRH